MSLDEQMRRDDFDPDVDRLERMLQSTTPVVSPPSLGVLRRIRDRRRRRRQIASGVGALALIAGSVSVGLLALQASDTLIGGGEAAITTVPGGAEVTEADVDRWLGDMPPAADSTALFLASSVPQPEAVREFIGCAWTNVWRDALDSGDDAQPMLRQLQNSDGWAVAQVLDPELESFAELAVASRFATNAAEAERTALWQRCFG